MLEGVLAGLLCAGIWLAALSSCVVFKMTICGEVLGFSTLGCHCKALCQSFRMDFYMVVVTPQENIVHSVL